jgi:hypothetical protein
MIDWLLVQPRKKLPQARQDSEWPSVVVALEKHSWPCVNWLALHDSLSETAGLLHPHAAKAKALFGNS